MFPLLVFLETLDEVDGGLVVLGCGDNEEVVRLLMADDVELLRQVALPAQIIARTHYKTTLGVVMQVSLLRVVEHGVMVVE